MVAFRFSGCFCWGPFVWVKEIHPNLHEIFPGSASLDSHIFVSLNLGGFLKWWYSTQQNPWGFPIRKMISTWRCEKWGETHHFPGNTPLFWFFFAGRDEFFSSFFVFGCPTGPQWTSSGARFFFGKKNPKGALWWWRAIGTNMRISWIFGWLFFWQIIGHTFPPYEIRITKFAMWSRCLAITFFLRGGSSQLVDG